MLTLLYGIRIRLMYRICVRDMRNAYYHKQKMKNQECPYAWPVIIGGNMVIVILNWILL